MANKPYVIGLRGVAGAGKTTVSAKLQTALNLPGRMPILLSMASPIRSALSSLGVHKGDPLYRELAQTLGARCRASDPDFFVKLAQHRIESTKGDNQVIIMDDIRYPNEEPLCDITFFIYPLFEPADLGPLADHESEQWNRDLHAEAREYLNESTAWTLDIPWSFEVQKTKTVLNRRSEPEYTAHLVLIQLPEHIRNPNRDRGGGEDASGTGTLPSGDIRASSNLG